MHKVKKLKVGLPDQDNQISFKIASFWKYLIKINKIYD